jgi:hypothetical protein
VEKVMSSDVATYLRDRYGVEGPDLEKIEPPDDHLSTYWVVHLYTIRLAFAAPDGIGADGWGWAVAHVDGTFEREPDVSLPTACDQAETRAAHMMTQDIDVLETTDEQ